MRVLIATAMYPIPDRPAFGSFVRTQVEALRQAGVDIELLVLSGRPRKFIYPKGVFQLRQRLSNHTIDLVHAHYGLVGMVARTQWQVPIVVTYHGDDLLGSRTASGGREFASELVAIAGRMLAHRIDAAIVQSEEMAASIRGANAHVIPHEINFEIFRPWDRDEARAMLGLDLQKKYILFANDPQIPVKRFSFAKTVAEYLNQQDSAIELLTIYKETQDRLALYMNACDALIFPSYQEGSPNVVKQAMACNLPIVATDVGDVRQLIGSTAGCYICESEVSAFAYRLGQILTYRARTQGNFAVRHLDAPLVARRIIDVYDEILKRRPTHQVTSTPLDTIA